MNNVIYSVFALVDGVSREIGSPTSSKEEACQFALDFFVSHDKKYPTKVVKTMVLNKVVDCFAPFKVCVHSCNKNHWFNSKHEYYNFTNNLILKHIPFTVSTFDYDC